MDTQFIDIGVIFGILVVLLAAIAFTSTLRNAGRRDEFSMDAQVLTDSGLKNVCGVAAGQVDATCGGDANVQKRLFFRDPDMDPSPNWGHNNSDPYFLGKVVAGPNQSSLRMTINDDADESFQIWGNACGTAAGCGGEGALAHKFRADGAAAVAGSLVVGSPDGLTSADRGWSSGTLNVYNRHADNWTQFPGAGGKNYIRNATQVDGPLAVGGALNINGGNQLCVGGVCTSSDTLRKVLAMLPEYKGRMAAVERKNGQQDGRIAALASGADARDIAYGAAKSELNTVKAMADLPTSSMVPVVVYSGPDFTGQSTTIMFDANGSIPFDAHGTWLRSQGIDTPRSFKLPPGVRLTVCDGEINT